MKPKQKQDTSRRKRYAQIWRKFQFRVKTRLRQLKIWDSLFGSDFLKRIILGVKLIKFMSKYDFFRFLHQVALTPPASLRLS